MTATSTSGATGTSDEFRSDPAPVAMVRCSRASRSARRPDRFQEPPESVKYRAFSGGHQRGARAPEAWPGTPSASPTRRRLQAGAHELGFSAEREERKKNAGEAFTSRSDAVARKPGSVARRGRPRASWRSFLWDARRRAPRAAYPGASGGLPSGAPLRGLAPDGVCRAALGAPIRRSSVAGRNGCFSVGIASGPSASPRPVLAPAVSVHSGSRRAGGRCARVEGSRRGPSGERCSGRAGGCSRVCTLGGLIDRACAFRRFFVSSAAACSVALSSQRRPKDEHLADGLARKDVIEAVVNAPAVYKNLAIRVAYARPS
jgi:hypothetical protein